MFAFTRLFTFQNCKTSYHLPLRLLLLSSWATGPWTSTASITKSLEFRHLDIRARIIFNRLIGSSQNSSPRFNLLLRLFPFDFSEYQSSTCDKQWSWYLALSWSPLSQVLHPRVVTWVNYARCGHPKTTAQALHTGPTCKPTARKVVASVMMMMMM